MSISSRLRTTAGLQRYRLETVLKKIPDLPHEFPSDEQKELHFLQVQNYKELLTTTITRFSETHKALEQCEDLENDEAINTALQQNYEVLWNCDEALAKLNVWIKNNGSEKRNSTRSDGDTLNNNPFTLEQLLQHQQNTFQQLINTIQVQQIQPQISKPKLPSLELSKFDGDFREWRTFWDTFQTMIHNNSGLSVIEKFHYLNSYLKGAAKAAIAGLVVSNENYETAIKTLKYRFGQDQLILDAHFKALTDLSPASHQLHSLRRTIDKIEQHLNSLEAMGEQLHEKHIITILRSKFPPEIIIRINELHGNETPWTLQQFRQRLQEYVMNRELLEEIQSNSSTRNQIKTNEDMYSLSTKPTTSALLVKNQKKEETRLPYNCVYCSEGHWSDECPKYTTVESRKNRIRGRCFLCFRKDHTLQQCDSQKKCFYCKLSKVHHSSLCPTKFKPKPEHVQISAENPNENEMVTIITNNPPNPAMLSATESVLMQTAQTFVSPVNNNLNSTKIRLLLDTGSHRSYISRHLMEKLALKPIGKETLSILTFGTTNVKQTECQVVEILLQLLDGTKFKINAHVVPGPITGSLQRLALNDNILKRPCFNSLQLADSFPHQIEDLNIEMLIGNDYYWDIVTGDKLEIGGIEGLYLISSKLGWILNGRCQITEANRNIITSMFAAVMSIQESSSHNFEFEDQKITEKFDVKKFWDLDTIGIRDPVEDMGDEEASLIFNSTISYVDGRYQVQWPWKSETIHLPDNYQLSLGRLNSLLRRHANNQELFKKYNEIIETQLKNNIIEKVNKNQQDGERVHYIPHHPVINSQKTSTKIRIVYDESAKIKSTEPSLNQCLYRGPVYLDDICSLLIRFRLYKVGIISDIEKAFLQVGLQLPDRDVTRFLWLADPSQLTTNNNLQIYRFTRVPFGVVSSPFLLAATIKHHLRRYDLPEATKINNNLYVDNLVTGTDSEQEAIQFYLTTKQLFNEASMNIREWASNSSIFLKNIPKEDQARDRTIMVLGYPWNLEEDSLTIHPTKQQITTKVITKRITLTHLASFYEPMGLLNPVFVRAKVFLQKLWRLKYQWDDPLPEELLQEWVVLKKDVDMVQELKIPRFIGLHDLPANNCQFDIHVFCDASKHTYVTCVYLSIINDKLRNCNLIFSKSRTGPLIPISLPRMELLAVYIGVKALRFIKKGLHKHVRQSFIWTDSQIVIHWIKTIRPLTSVFVSNRIKEIKREDNIQFKYVPTSQNPADIASRGSSPTTLSKNSLWWYGPQWLKQDPSSWPSETSTSQNFATMENLQEPSLVQSDRTSKQAINLPLSIEYTKYSSLDKLLRITARCLRFVRVIQKRIIVNEKFLTSRELQQAKLLWIKYIQALHFPEMIHAIKSNSKNNLKDQLELWLDEDNLIRCGGRIKYANLPELTIHPILLPKKDHFTKLVIQEKHERLLHAGVSHTLAEIRQEFWIPSGRFQVYNFIKTCPRCKRYDGGHYNVPNFPPLPPSRVQRSTAFTYTGIDYLGPFYIKSRHLNKDKVWICIFCCMSTRAIHLEVVTNLTATEFLLSFKRFIGRRGTPKMIWSDNATVFRKASSMVNSEENIIDDEVITYLNQHEVQWHYIVERAPWRGGFYERLIQLVKQCFRKGIGPSTSLNLIQLQTITTEIEAIINSRPLVYVGEDFTSGFVLTPAHLLSQNTKTSLNSTSSKVEDDEQILIQSSRASNLKENWKKGQRLLDHFWKIWQREYLLGIRERNQMKMKQSKNKTNQIPKLRDVVIVQNNGPRGTWKLGLVEEFLVDHDDKIRATKVRLANGRIITRSIRHLYPLECDECSELFVRPGMS